MLGIYKVNSLIVSRAVHFTHDSKNLYFFLMKTAFVSFLTSP